MQDAFIEDDASSRAVYKENNKDKSERKDSERQRKNNGDLYVESGARPSKRAIARKNVLV